jgi:hypothetical protein
MPKVMIKCPETSWPVDTGITMDKESFESSTSKDKTLVNCPACGKNHLWSKEDAFLEEA